MTESDSNRLKMVDRACLILDYLYGQEHAASISVISKELDLPKANVFRILHTLQANGLVQKSVDSDLYQLGNKLIQYGDKVRHDFTLVDACKLEVDQLAGQIGETVNLGIMYDQKVLTIYSAQGERSALVSKLIPIAQPYCSSMGKLYLSELDHENIQAYFNQDLEKRTVNTITDLDTFLEQREYILHDGIAFDREEYEYGLSCMAVPIRNNKGQTIAMLSVSGPTTRLEFKNLNSIIDLLKEVPKRLEQDPVIQVYSVQ